MARRACPIPKLAGSLLPLLPLLPIPAATAGPVTYTVIARSGQAAPNLPTLTFEAVADPRIDDVGTYVFWARLAGAGVTTSNDGSLWTNRSGTLALLLREDAPAVGTPDRYVGLGTPAWSGAGQFALTASLGTGTSASPTNLAQMIESGGVLSLVARETTQVPVLGLLSLNDAGTVIFRAGDGSALYSTRSGLSTSIVTSATPAPGASNPAATFAVLGQPTHNIFGAAAFWATVTYPGQTVPESGIWSDSGGLHLVARTGQQAPGQNADVVFADLDTTPRLDIDGNLAFWARLSGPGVDAANDGSVWRTINGVPQIVAREGTPAPIISGTTIAELARHVQLADSGFMLFRGSINGPGVTAANNSAIWSTDPVKGLALIAREGDQVPGLPAGVQYAVLGRPGLTATGRVAFTTSLRSAAGLPQTSTFALIASDGRAALFPIARAGDPFTLAPGDTRTIAHIAFDHGDPQTGYSQFSTTGTLVFKLAFTDNSSALVAATIALCLADFNSDGFANGADFDDFASAFAAGDPTADLNGDTFVNGLDFDIFAAAFEAGC